MKGSGIILCDSTERILLVLGREHNKWSFPKGHLDDTDTDTRMCAIRETKEETGLDVVIPEEAGYRTFGDYKYYFLGPEQVVGKWCLCPQDQDEVVCAKWFTVLELLDLEGCNSAVRKYRRIKIENLEKVETKDRTMNNESTNKNITVWGTTQSQASIINDSDFPELGIVEPLTKKEQRVQNEQNITKYIMTPQQDHYPTKRDQAFARLENKDEMSRALQRTKACRHVTESKEKTGKYGVCYRTVCTFAHSQEEYNDPCCSFGDECRYVDGRRDRKTGTMKKCMFRHPFETREMYHNRTDKSSPDLPETAEHTRKPKVEKATKQVGQRKTMRPKLDLKLLETVVEVDETPRAPTVPIAEKVMTVPREMFASMMQLAMEQGWNNISIKIAE